MRFTASRYNLPIQHEGSLELLFNCRTGSMVSVPGPLRPFLDHLLDGDSFDLEELPPEVQALVGGLATGGFFVDEGFDELEAVRRRVLEGPDERTLNLTILPTMACNLRCTYCYQVRQGILMSEGTQDTLLREVERRIREERVSGLEVDWFGGEPLVARRVVRELSARLMDLAHRCGLPYRATMATNGTLLDESLVETLVEAGLDEIQITLDGPPEVHDRRRPTAGGGASFDAVIHGILVASLRLKVIVRINVDRDTVDDAWRVLDQLEAMGCFAVGRSVLPYIALTGPLSSVCAHTCDALIPAGDFFGQVLAFQKAVLDRQPSVDLGQLLGIPQPLDRACGAHSRLSMLVHPSGKVFKCGLEVHEPRRAAGFVGQRYWEHPNYYRWVDHDPFGNADCLACRFLPLCLGGCPKYNADPESPFHREACVYFKSFLIPTLVLYAQARARQGGNVGPRVGCARV